MAWAVLRAGLLAALWIVSGPAAAFAQPSRASVSMTYTWLRDADADRTYTPGASVEGAVRVFGWLSATVEVAISTAGEDFASTGGGTYDFRYESLQAGPRLAPSAGLARPYVELLAGATRWRIRERRLDRTGWESVTDFSLQPGAGVDVFITPHVAFRIGGDLRVLFKHDNRFDKNYRTTLYRAHAGVSVHFGGS